MKYAAHVQFKFNKDFFSAENNAQMKRKKQVSN